MLDSLPEAPVPMAMMDQVLARVRCESEAVTAPSAPSRSAAHFLIPEPLRSYVGGDVDGLNWTRMAPRVHQIQINTPNSRSQARLLRFQSGTTVPAHGHRGRELTLVLTGSLCDRDTILYRGDIAETDERTEHQPHAGTSEDCICLAVTDAPLRFKSMFARLLQPLFGI
jgi:putative transcriptional regulator